MSDRSSESSCEWVILNDEEEELSLDSIEQPLNLELNYDAICHAVSDSIRSSLSSEELEWQYEQFGSSIPSYHHSSHVQELDFRESDLEGNESEDSNVEDDMISKCASTGNIDEDLNLASISKIQSYKHNRNDNLNFILNLMLALVVASTIGLGIGHFLGWSHKCHKIASTLNEATDTIKLPKGVLIKQNIENSKINLLPFSKKLSNSASCKTSTDEVYSKLQEICNVPSDSNIDTILSESPVIQSSDVSEFKSSEKISQNNFSDYHVLNLPHVSNIVTNMDWNGLSGIETIKQFHNLKEVLLGDVNDDSSNADEIQNSNHELFNENYINQKKLSEENKEILYTELIGLFNQNDDFFHRNDLDNEESQLLKYFLSKEKDSHKESNLTSQLREDLNEVLQSLSAIALTRLADFDKNYPVSVEQLGKVIKLYKDFQYLINTRITDIDNFVLSSEYKKHQKLSPKYLQKTVYSLVDAVDYLMKLSAKTLNKDNKRINIYKFSDSISKVIFNFNKKWEKNNRYWSETVKNSKFQESQEGYNKKKDKQWKRKVQYEKHDFRNYKNRRYSMKS